MADTTTQERQTEHARAIAVSLEAELAMVGSLVRALTEQHLVKHNHIGALSGATSPHCPACQLAAWSRSA